MKLRICIVILPFFGCWMTSSVHSQLHANESCDLLSPSISSTGIQVGSTELDQTTEMWKNVTLTCKYYNYCSITWYHRGLEFHPPTNGRVQIINGDQELFITNVTEEDSGSYSCVVYNSTDNVTSKGFLLVRGIEIMELAIIRHQIGNLVTTGEDISLTCEAVNHDKITWYHNEELITPTWDRHYFQDSGQRLLIQPVTLEDMGKYTCVASNSSTNVSRTGLVKVSYRDEGDVILTNCLPGFNITAPLGSNLTVKCTFNVGFDDGDFLPIWYKVNESATDDYYDRTSWISPTILDFNGATVSIPPHILETKEDTNSLKSIYYVTIQMIITNITVEVYGHYIVHGYKGYNWQPNLITISKEKGISVIIKVAAVISPSVTFIVIFILLFVTWKKFHLDIKLFVNTVNNNLIWKKEEIKDGKLYDVYIACSDKDATFVVNILLPLLTEKGYTTCLRLIDFLPGESNNEAIWRYMKTSRCCLLIVSEGMFSDHDLVQTEMQAATEIFSDHKNGVIPVMFDNVSDTDVKQSSSVLKHYLLNNPKLTLKKDDRLNPKTLRKSSALKGVRLALPHPSEKIHAVWRRHGTLDLIQEEVQPAVQDQPATNFVMNSITIENHPKLPKLVVNNNNRQSHV